MEFYPENKHKMKYQQDQTGEVNANLIQSKKISYTKEDAGVLLKRLSIAANRIIKIQVENESSKNELKEHINDLKGSQSNQTKTIASLHKQVEFLEDGIQNEVRLRDDVINKVTNTREICNAVEEHTKALEKVLIACQEDRQVLCDSYHQAVDVITKIKNDQVNVENRYLNEISTQKSLLENEKMRFNESNKHWSEMKIQMEHWIENLSQQINSKDETMQSLRREKEGCDKQISLLMDENENLKQAMRSQLLNETNYNEEKGKLLKEQSKIAKALQDRENQLSQREKELESLRTAKINIDIDIQHTMNENCELKKCLEMNVKQLEEANEKLKEIEYQLEVNKNERENARESVSLLNEKLTDKNAGFKEMEKQLNNFKSIKADLENNMKEMQLDMEKKESKWQEDKKQLMNNMNEFINQELKKENAKVVALEAELSNKSMANTSLMEELNNYMNQSVTSEKSLEEAIKKRELLEYEIIILKNCITSKNEEIKEILLKVDTLQEEYKALEENAKLAISKSKVQQKSECTQTLEEKIHVKEIMTTNTQQKLIDIKKIPAEDKEIGFDKSQDDVYEFNLSDSSIDSTVEKILPSSFYQFYRNHEQNKRISSTNDPKTNLITNYENADIYKKPVALKSRNKPYKKRNTK